jgi:hypothetical protein
MGDGFHRWTRGIAKMTIFRIKIVWHAFLVTGFTLVIAMLLAQPASADGPVPPNDDGHHWDISATGSYHPLVLDPSTWQPYLPPPCPLWQSIKRCAGTASWWDQVSLLANR